jgi:hypothetical protein
MTDTPSAELLARYSRRHDEAAAEELFRRYPILSAASC